MSSDNDNINTNISEHENMKRRYEAGFITILMKTLKHLEKRHPTPEITIGISALNNISMDKPSAAITLFLKYLYMDDDCRNNMRDGNMEFFISTDYVEKKAKDVNEDSTFDEIFDFRSKWNLFSDKTKDKVQNNMSRLIKICDEYIDLLNS